MIRIISQSCLLCCSSACDMWLGRPPSFVLCCTLFLFQHDTTVVIYMIIHFIYSINKTVYKGIAAKYIASLENKLYFCTGCFYQHWSASALIASSLYLDTVDTTNTIKGFAMCFAHRYQYITVQKDPSSSPRHPCLNTAKWQMSHPVWKMNFNPLHLCHPTIWKDWLPPIAYLKCLIPPLRNLFTWIRDN